ncbi:MAG: hypothetical protein QM658_05275 [Gordonia sp. (in: high G+C Gram-positive bacteria)]
MDSRRAAAALALAACAAVSTGCGASSTTTASQGASAASSVGETAAQKSAEQIKRAVRDVVELRPVTSESDPNRILGKPNGYVAVTVLVDSRVHCSGSELGVDCGAVVEQWPDHRSAKERAEYVTSALQGMPGIEPEHQVVKGDLLLRVSGELKPSAVHEYEKAFKH